MNRKSAHRIVLKLEVETTDQRKRSVLTSEGIHRVRGVRFSNLIKPFFPWAGHEHKYL